MTKRNTEVPGNTLESQRLFDREMIKIGRAVLSLQSRLEHMADEGVEVKALRLTYRNGVHGEVLCVVTAGTESGGIVAFHSADGLGEVLKGVSARMVNGSIKWKEDEYARDD